MKATILQKVEEAKKLFSELHKPHIKKEYTQQCVGEKLFVSTRTVRRYLNY
jgi:DNA-binding transcriptional regulator LsrR (DeoR family)